MESRHQVLVTLFNIVKNETQPLHYPCKPRDLLLRMLTDWSLIHSQLTALEADGLVRTEQRETLVIFLTGEGLQAARELHWQANAGSDR